jgi:amino acid transporter
MEIHIVGRPRNVGWLRAAALLYGDWGTSKAYVLGIALSLVGFSALPHALAVCALTALVGFNYIWICRFYPNGGGVYTAARAQSARLAVIGALLLMADYIVTASLSCLDGFHYLGLNVEPGEAKKCAISAIFAIGAVNFFGPKHSSGIALILAVPTVLVVIILICFGVPHLSQLHVEPPTGGFWHNWRAFVGMILALSGVEAIANATGVMKLDPGSTYDKPIVAHTARKAILLVMFEVVLGTATLAVLAHCLPPEALNHTEDLLRFMGDYFVGHWFGSVVGIVFGLLLLSAVNTSMVDMVAILYLMAKDREMPQPFIQLNSFGVPWVPLFFATILPVIVLNADDSVDGLAALYAIGVVGAITINLGSCAFNSKLEMHTHERWLMRFSFVILAAIWITIAVTKIYALLFVSLIVGCGLALREFTQRRLRTAIPAVSDVPDLAQSHLGQLHHELELAPAAFSESHRPHAEQLAAPAAEGGKILVAARGFTPALKFALEEAALRNARLVVLYIKEVAVQIQTTSDWQDDPFAKELFTKLRTEASGIKMRTIYSVSNSPADTIVDIAGVVHADLVVLGGSKRAALIHILKGNIIDHVASNLPEQSRLVIIA